MALTYFGVKNSSSAYISSTPCSRAGLDHVVGLFQRHAQRLLADDVLAGVGDVERHLAVQAVGRRDRDHLDVGSASICAVVGEPARDAVALRELLGVAGRGRGDGDDLRFFAHLFDRGGVDVGLEPRADDADFDLVSHDPPPGTRDSDSYSCSCSYSSFVIRHWSIRDKSRLKMTMCPLSAATTSTVGSHTNGGMATHTLI